MKLNRVAALIGKEVRELTRDRITLALAFLMPLVLLFLFGYAVTLDVKGIRLGVYDGDGTPASRALLDRFTTTPYFVLSQRYATLGEIEPALQRNEVRIVLVVPAQFQRRLAAGEPAPVQVIADGTYAATAALAAGYAEQIINGFPAARIPGVRIESRVWYNPALRSANFVVPGLFAVILMAFPPLLTALAIVREKESGSIQQIYASPVTSAEFVAAKLVPYAGVALLEVLLLAVVGTLWFDVPFVGSPLLLLVASCVYVLTTVAVGLFVSVVTRTQLTAMLVALLVSLMPSMLFSGFLFPTFTMPLGMQLYSAAIPASYFTEVSRGIVLKGIGWNALWPNLTLLMAYTLILFGFAAWRLKQKVAR